MKELLLVKMLCLFLVQLTLIVVAQSIDASIDGSRSCLFTRLGQNALVLSLMKELPLVLSSKVRVVCFFNARAIAFLVR